MGGLGLLSANEQGVAPMQALSQATLLGMDAYAGGKDRRTAEREEKRRREMERMQMQQARMEMQRLKQQQLAQQKAQALYLGGTQPAAQTAGEAISRGQLGDVSAFQQPGLLQDPQDRLMAESYLANGQLDQLPGLLEQEAQYRTIQGDRFGQPGAVFQRNLSTGELERVAAPVNGQDMTADMQNAAALGLVPGTPEYQEYLRQATLPSAASRMHELSPGERLVDPMGEVVATGGPDPKKRIEAQERLFKRTDKLRDEFAQEAKPFKELASRYGNIIASAKKPSGAGDLSMIYSYMKMLDPTSTVMQGEYATVENVGSVPDRVVGLYNRLLEGNKLSPNQRADFVERSGMIYGQALRQQTQIEDQYRGLSKRYGVKPKNVLLDYRADIPPAEAQVGIPQVQGPQGGLLGGANKVVIPNHPQHGDITIDDIKTTARESGMTEQEVMQRLGVQ